MSSALPQLPPGWEDLFEPDSLEKGRVLAADRAVESLVWNRDQDTLTARVRVSKRSVVKVEIGLEDGTEGWEVADVFCGCDEVFDCAHAAAVLQVLTERSTLGLPTDAARSARLDPRAEQWLEALANAAQSPASRAPETIERIAYVLRDGSNAEEPGTIALEMWKVRPRKSGGLGSVSAVEFEKCLKDRPARYVDAADVRIARRIHLEVGRYSLGYHRMHLAGEGGAEILAAVLRTGRGHWSNLETPPLRLGAARMGQPVWRPDPAGRHRASFDLTPPATRVLALCPPWYLDEGAGECGPIESPLSNRIAEVWSRAPAFDPLQTVGLRENLARLAPVVQVPAPEAVPTRIVTGVEPAPGLFIRAERLQWWETPWGFQNSGGADGIRCFVVEPRFHYQDRTVPARPYAPEVRSFNGQELVIMSRDRAREEAALMRLQRMGLRPAEEVLTYRAVDRLRGRWMLSKPGDAAWITFASQDLTALRADGWRVETEPGCNAEVFQPEGWYLENEAAGNEDWFEVELGVLVGEERVNLLPVLMEALRRGGESFNLKELSKAGATRPIPVPLPDGRTIAFPAGRLRSILSTLIELYEPQALDSNQKLRLHRLRAAELADLANAPGWKWTAPAALQDLAERLRKLEGLPDCAPPEGLQTSLRPYQVEGLRWLQFVRELGVGGVLADDMGLGKTIQTLAHLLVEKESGRLDRPALVVCPTSLLVNWREEASRFAPSLRVLILHGTERHERFADVAQADLLVTSYSLIPRDAEKLVASEFHAVILDEAQNIKNPRTQAAQVVCQLKARHRLCLTGTPLENHLGELWSLYHFLMPGFLLDEIRFRTLFRNPIEKVGDEARRKLLFRRVKPFLIRRRKDQVALELPPKTEVIRKVELTGAQRDLYETIRLAMEQRVRQEVERNGINRSHIIILDALLKLRQACCDPRLVRLESARRVEESAKLELLMDLLPTLLEDGRRILLFSQFTSMLALIQEELQERKIPYVLLTGETDDRATPVNRFQAGEVPLFLLSLKAGGTGLNLTAADTVILYDPWWNPAVEAQATDRAHRIGQNKPVFVYRLLTVGTVEEKMEALQVRKRELVQGLLEEGAGGPLTLEKADLELLFAPLR